MNVYTALYGNKMALDFNDGLPVTLEQMLLAKEQRVHNQQRVITRYQSAIISLTLVIPGEIKKSSAADYLFQQAILAIQTSLLKHNVRILNQINYQQLTGNEAIIAVDCPADSLKAYCIDIEINHPLGRLWDIDVIDPLTKSSISRTQYSYPVRQCLICGDNAKICSRSRRHTRNELIAMMLKMVNKQERS